MSSGSGIAERSAATKQSNFRALLTLEQAAAEHALPVEFFARVIWQEVVSQ